MTRWAFDPHSGKPLITISCNGRHLRCILDTGFSEFIWMERRVAERHQVYLPPGAEEFRAFTAGGNTVAYKLGYAGKMLFAEVLFEDVPIQVYEGRGNEHPLLGMRMLVGFVVMLDCNEGFTQIINPALRTDR